MLVLFAALQQLLSDRPGGSQPVAYLNYALAMGRSIDSQPAADFTKPFHVRRSEIPFG